MLKPYYLLRLSGTCAFALAFLAAAGAKDPTDDMGKFRERIRQEKSLLAENEREYAKLRAEFDDLAKNLEDGKVSGEAARKRHAELLDRLSGVTRELANLNTNRRAADDRNPGELRGVVKQYEADGALLSLNVGNDQGVFEGQMLEISPTRNGSGFRVTARVIQASPNRCIVLLMNGGGRLPLRAGDGVSLDRGTARR